MQVPSHSHPEKQNARETQEAQKYAAILDLPHYVSKTRPPMSLHDRAAQFSPFDALKTD